MDESGKKEAAEQPTEAITKEEKNGVAEAEAEAAPAPVPETEEKPDVASLESKGKRMRGTTAAPGSPTPGKKQKKEKDSDSRDEEEYEEEEEEEEDDEEDRDDDEDYEDGKQEVLKWICCDGCDTWLVAGPSGDDPEVTADTTKFDEGAEYLCPACRGETKKKRGPKGKMDVVEKKWRQKKIGKTGAGRGAGDKPNPSVSSSGRGRGGKAGGRGNAFGRKPAKEDANSDNAAATAAAAAALSALGNLAEETQPFSDRRKEIDAAFKQIDLITPSKEMSKEVLIEQINNIKRHIMVLQSELGFSHLDSGELNIVYEEFHIPPHCVPIRADVRSFDWEALGKEIQFDVVLMDPPWQIASRAPTRGVTVAYAQLPNSEIMDMNIPAVQKDGFIFIWVVNKHFGAALEMLDKWGYKLVDDITWVKSTVNRRLAKGHGFYLQHAKETCLVGKKGRDPPNINCNVFSDVIISERRGQSQKPTELYDLIEAFIPGGNYLEIFGRRNNLKNGWVTIGNEI